MQLTDKKQKTLAENQSTRVFYFLMWYRAESNRRHKDFQSFALPTELRYHPVNSTNSVELIS